MSELSSSQLTEILINQNQMLNTLINKGKKTNAQSIIKTLKPSVTIEQFIEDLEIISPTKLLNYKLPHYYALIILHNIEKYPEKDRPIMLTDAKKKNFYFYSIDGNTWNKDTKKYITLIRNKLFKMVTTELLERKKLTNCNEEVCLCISTFFDVDKYPNEKLIEKITIDLTKIMNVIDYESE